MEHMRMDPKHQFAAQYVLSRAAAERRECDSILAATLAASTGGITSSGNGLLPLLCDDGGSNSLCASPSANSECSSTDRLSSASDHGSNLQVTNQYGVGVEADMHLTKHMSLMAAASAAAAAVAASANGASVSAGINMSGSSVGNITSNSGCADSTRSRVQAAVVNLAAAMRIKQVNQQQSDENIAISGSGTNSAQSSSESTPIQQIMHPQHHLQQKQQQVSTPDNIQLSVSAPIEAGGFSLGESSPKTGTVISNIQSDVSTVNAVVSMTAMRDTMIRTGMSVVDPLNGILEQHKHSNVQHQITSDKPNAHHSDTQNRQTTPSSSHQLQHQESSVLQNPDQHHHHHRQHVNHIQPQHSPERKMRLHQHAEAILRSHTEAAFRLAASAASNGVMGAGSIITVITEPNMSENTIPPNDNIIQDQAEGQHTQQQQPPIQHHHPMPQQQQKLNIGGSQQQLPIITPEQTHITSELSEAIRFQEQRLEQALRLHSDARALNFLTSSHQNANVASGLSTVVNTTTQHQLQQQPLTTHHPHSNA